MFLVMKLVTSAGLVCDKCLVNSTSALCLVTQSKLCLEFQLVPFLGELSLK